jgi:hypothetical protein
VRDEAGKATSARGTLAACVANIVGGGCVVVGWAQARASSSGGETGARMLTGPGDSMEEPHRAAGSADAGAAHALSIAIGVHGGRELRTAGPVAQDTVAVGGKGTETT